MLEQMLGASEARMDEDCLLLNVFTPDGDGQGGSGGRPVMVWIHGGGFLTGSGSIPWYDGTNLARRGVVVVTLNYRLGVFGFLHLEELSVGFEGSGNAGILDQVAALTWVRDNIAAFGGDPANVTVFGESAGAMSIATLLGVPAAAGLFHRAILQSGAGAHVHDADAATAMARTVLAEAGADPADPGALRALPVADLLEVQRRIAQATPFEGGLPLQPVVDGTVLPERPTAAVAAGRAAGVELLVGTTLEEMKLFLQFTPGLAELDEDGLRRRSDRFFVPAGHAPGEAVAVYRRRLSEAQPGAVWTAMLTDHTFRIPALRLVEAQLGHQPGVWMYLFAQSSGAFGGALGSCHALDVPFVWDNLDARGAGLFVGDLTEPVRELARILADAWVAFATDGVPSVPGMGTWPAYDTGRRATLWAAAGDLRVVDDPMADERILWQGIDR
jgi:para-nitrobenzyl esterase